MSSTSSHASTMRTAASGGAPKREYVQEIFSEIAPRYDLLNHLLSMNIDRGWRKKAIEALDWRRNPGGTYVDLCAGTLDVGVMLASQAGFKGQVIGADFAEPMLRHGISKTAGKPVSAVASDALQLPLPNGRAAGAIVAFGIRNVASLDDALAEVRRVLEPGARFVILEFTTPPNFIVRHSYHFYFYNILPIIGRIISGHPTAYQYLPESVKHFPGPDSLADRMRAAGFADVRYRLLMAGIIAIHSGTRK